MDRKIICFGCRTYELPYFKSLGEKYGYEMVTRPEYLNNDNYELALGYENVMVRGNCFVDREHLAKLKEKGLKYYLTRTAGFNHVDVAACKDLGIETAYVPGYSPNAISELALTLAMTLLRHVQYSANLTSKGQFKVTDTMFSKEIRDCTVGILGCGRIGRVTASLFKGLGAKVVGYDVFVSPACKGLIDMKKTPLEVMKESDIVVCHMAYIPGKNDKFISKEFIDAMKPGAILINVARGEVLDNMAALQAVKEGRLGGLGLDVIDREKTLFNKVHDPKDMKDEEHQLIVDLYPKVLITPHIGSATEHALIDMIEVTLQNLEEYRLTGKCKNSLIK
jgi:D-lactate dehydrogenase